MTMYFEFIERTRGVRVRRGKSTHQGYQFKELKSNEKKKRKEKRRKRKEKEKRKKV